MDKYTPIEHIIAKLDNDFNLDNSDWIPRVAAWTIEAMSQIKALKKVKKKHKLKVKNRIAKTLCCIEKQGLKVYDSRGCEIDEADNKPKCGKCCSSPTGEHPKEHNHNGGFGGFDVSDAYEDGRTPYDGFQIHTTKYPPHDARIVDRFVIRPGANVDRNYTLVDCNTIELNFDDTCITVEYDDVPTIYSEYFQADVPVIPNNGLLIEAIGYYCLYKMLCRGMKHPVFNLGASQYGTNPYYMWIQLKDKAKRSVDNDEFDERIDKASAQWRGYFYNYTFNNK